MATLGRVTPVNESVGAACGGRTGARSITTLPRRSSRLESPAIRIAAAAGLDQNQACAAALTGQFASLWNVSEEENPDESPIVGCERHVRWRDRPSGVP